MSASAYNPKVSLLVKLAEIVLAAIDAAPVSILVEDPEILEWYDRMADLQHVPRRGIPVDDDLSEDDKALNRTALEAAGYPDVPVSQVAINDAIAPREGYQIFATQSVNHEAEDVASYTEATSVEEAMQRCCEQFHGYGYFNHGVKNIETQIVTMYKKPTALSLD